MSPRPVLGGAAPVTLDAPAPHVLRARVVDRDRPALLASGSAHPGGSGETAVGGDDVRRDQVVAGKAVLALEPADAAAERQARDAGGRDGAAGGREAERLRLAVELAPRQARLRAQVRVFRSTRMGPRAPVRCVMPVADVYRCIPRQLARWAG